MNDYQIEQLIDSKIQRGKLGCFASALVSLFAMFVFTVCVAPKISEWAATKAGTLWLYNEGQVQKLQVSSISVDPFGVVRYKDDQGNWHSACVCPYQFKADE